MHNIDLRQIVLALIGLFFIYKFILKPIINLIISLINMLSIISVKKKQSTIIIKFPSQDKIKRNIAEIISWIVLFFVIIFIFRSYYGIVIMAGVLTIISEIVTPIIYDKYNGIYPEWIIYNKKHSYINIHSWKKIEENKKISFLEKNGLRFDVFMGKEFNNIIEYLNSRNISEEI